MHFVHFNEIQEAKKKMGKACIRKENKENSFYAKVENKTKKKLTN